MEDFAPDLLVDDDVLAEDPGDASKGIFDRRRCRIGDHRRVSHESHLVIWADGFGLNFDNRKFGSGISVVNERLVRPHLYAFFIVLFDVVLED